MNRKVIGLALLSLLTSSCGLFGVKPQCYTCETYMVGKPSYGTVKKEICDKAERDKYIKDNSMMVGNNRISTVCKLSQ